MKWIRTAFDNKVRFIHRDLLPANKSTPLKLFYCQCDLSEYYFESKIKISGANLIVGRKSLWFIIKDHSSSSGYSKDSTKWKWLAGVHNFKRYSSIYTCTVDVYCIKYVLIKIAKKLIRCLLFTFFFHFG